MDRKKVMEVMIHEGSSLGSCERNLKKICKGTSFERGLAIHGSNAFRSENKVKAWAEKIG